MGQKAYAFVGHEADDRAADWLTPTVSLFGDSVALELMGADVRGAGLSVRGARPLVSLLDGGAQPLGEVVIVDCRQVSGAGLAALVRLDERAARGGAEVIALASAQSLEDVFGCLAAASVQYLLDPSQAERVVALGLALARRTGSCVREMEEEDRLALLRLTQEVSRLSSKVDRLAVPLGQSAQPRASAYLLSPGVGYDAGRASTGRQRPPLPDPRLVQQIIRQRRLRERFFDADLFADPAWDILLDLTAARAEHRRVPVSSLCIAAAVPPTTALRWIAQMTDAGLLVREQDSVDKRRAFLTLSDRAADAMARYFDALGVEAMKLV